MPCFVIAQYRCFVAGVQSESVDFQVRYFQSDNISAAHEFLQNEKASSYRNNTEEVVEWHLEAIVATEIVDELKDSLEVIGFITGQPLGSFTIKPAKSS